MKAIRPLACCLLAASLLSCDLTSPAESGCEGMRPATLIITGVPGTAYACGGIVRNTTAFVGVSFMDSEMSNNAYVTLQVGAAPNSYPVSAANYGKIGFNYATSDQGGFCNTPSGTILVRSYTSPGPNNDVQLGRIEGSFTNVTLCRQGSSGTTASYVVSGTFEIR